MGGFLTPYDVGGGTLAVGQPTMIRMQGIPTMPGYRDRPGKWNALLPPFIAIALRTILDQLIELIR
jgi:hypothetical protein